jgi:cardiolipin synthase
VEGALVTQINDAVRHLWRVVSSAARGRRVMRFWRYLSGKRKRAASPHLDFVQRDSVRHRRDIEQAYLQAIFDARAEIILANAYFLPGRAFRKALKSAATRGVRVVVLLQGRVEYWLQHHATRELYGELLAAGIEIYEYQASFLHAKVAVVDSEWATVGSSNIDPFSLFLAKEANLVVRDAGFARQLRASLLEEIGQCAGRIQTQQVDLFSRALSRVSYALIRWAIGLLGIARRK